MLELSVVVVVYNIPRAVPRTLFALSADYQRQIDPDDYEVIVVDNGSSPALDWGVIKDLRGHFRMIRIDDAPRSPAHAVNRGIAAARGDIIGVVIDGARIVTPGLLHFSLLGTRSHAKAVVASMGWYLGGDYQCAAAEAGYDETREDALLASIDWPADGYRLFEIGTMDESSVDGWLTPIAETNTLFLRHELWEALGGMDERFDVPGGGLVNLDTYRRAMLLDGAEPVVLLGEGSFHQLHGGISTNAAVAQQPDNWNRWHGQYRSLRGQDFAHPPWRNPPTLIGTLPPAALSRFVRSALDPAKPNLRPLGPRFDRGIWSADPQRPPEDPTTRALVDLVHREFRAGRAGSAGAVARVARQHAPEDRELQRLLSLAAHAINAEPVDAHRCVAMGQAHLLLGDNDAAVADYRAALACDPNFVEAHVGLSQLRMPGDNYLVWLQWLYDVLDPVTAIEIAAPADWPAHSRIDYVTGSSTDDAIVRRVRDQVGGRRAMVVLDSDHTADHVHAELVAYSPLVQRGDYLIVEDTNVNGHPAYPSFGPGPMEAVNRFLAYHDDFCIDERCERFLMTLCPRGYLRRRTA